MDNVLADTLRANLKRAHSPEDKLNAIVLSLIAIIDCQLKTTAMVKTMWEGRNRTFWLAKIVQAFLASGFFAILIPICKKFGII